MSSEVVDEISNHWSGIGHRKGSICQIPGAGMHLDGKRQAFGPPSDSPASLPRIGDSWKKYSLLGLSIVRTSKEQMVEEKKGGVSSTLASRMAKKISSVLGLRRSSSQRKSTLAASGEFHDEGEAQCKYFSGESQRFCPDISASRGHGESQRFGSDRSASRRRTQ